MDWKGISTNILSKLLRPGASASAAAAILSTPLKLIAPRRKVALQNLKIALPDATPQELRRIVKKTYEHLIWVGIEMLILRQNPKQVLNWVETENNDVLELVRGGAILVIGHVGNWELAAAWGAQMGYKITAIVRDADDIAERGLINGIRHTLGVDTLSKLAPMTRAISILKRGEYLGILPDQHGGPEGIQAPLFGLQTSTSQGAAVFAYLTKKPLLPIFTHRIAPYRHVVRFGEPISWQKQATREATILEITTKINGSVEQMIREAPDQWLAQHKRFKEHY